MLKLLIVWITANCGKFLKELEILDHLTCLLRNLYAGQEATVRRKECVEAVYCHPAYSTYMQNTSRQMPGWMKHKLKSRFPGEISITSDMQMAPPSWQKAKTKEPLDERERGE